MITSQRFTELWTDYLEGELDEAGVSELRELLAADECLLKYAADLYQTHRLLGLIVAEETTRRDQFVRDTLARLPEDSEHFATGVMRRLAEQSVTRSDTSRRGQLAVNKTSRVTRRHVVLSSGWVLAALAAIPLLLLLVQTRESPTTDVVGQQNANADNNVTPASEVRFARLAHARFFGELSPPANSPLGEQREYVLMSGLAKIAFPNGASAIVEGPAVFRVLSAECLALDVGKCSVHAPDGAEGFRVETPVTRVVDRGTRFTVNVSETSETEVQVVEGAADVYQQSGERAAGSRENETNSVALEDGSFERRLTEREAHRFQNDSAFTTEPTAFDPAGYRQQLTDRIVSFEATSASDGRAENLMSVTVQRGGQEIRYPVDALIPVELTWFKSKDEPDRSGHLVVGAALDSPRIDGLSDTALNTGVINPGGSVRPLRSDPVMNATGDGTPGMAIRFQTPVTNRPGPDVVFFELQTMSNPPDGDAFHVSPLIFSEGRRSCTIRTYDLTLSSPEALKLTGFYLYKFDQVIMSPDELLTTKSARTPARLNFRAVAVGIDLADLGFLPDEQVDALFFQDAQDNDHLVDPVLIGGLP